MQRKSRITAWLLLVAMALADRMFFVLEIWWAFTPVSIVVIFLIYMEVGLYFYERNFDKMRRKDQRNTDGDGP